MAEGDIADPIDYGSLVRNNLMKRPGYAPYCGTDGCWRRAPFDGEQFKCPCGWRSDFPVDFIAGYKKRWHQAKGHIPALRAARLGGAKMMTVKCEFDPKNGALQSIDIVDQGGAE